MDSRCCSRRQPTRWPRPPEMTGLTVAAEALTTKLLKETREELAKADAKASMLGAAALVVVGAVLGGIIANNWSPAQIGAGLWRATWWLGVGFTLGALVCFGAAVFPRLRAAEIGRVTYFKDVVEHDSCAELVPQLNLEAERDDRDAEQ